MKPIYAVLVTSMFVAQAQAAEWQDLIDDVRTMLPSKIHPSGRNNCLGRSVMLGHKGWFAQGKSLRSQSRKP